MSKKVPVSQDGAVPSSASFSPAVFAGLAAALILVTVVLVLLRGRRKPAG